LVLAEEKGVFPLPPNQLLYPLDQRKTGENVLETYKTICYLFLLSFSSVAINKPDWGSGGRRACAFVTGKIIEQNNIVLAKIKTDRFFMYNNSPNPDQGLARSPTVVNAVGLK
jgi:hypothetical protein